MISRITAIMNLRPGAKWVMRGDILEWQDSAQTKPTEEEIKLKILELEQSEPYRILRIKRDKLLKECDWVTLPDVQLSEEKKTAWLNYRQALRDLPDNVIPRLEGNHADDTESLTGIEWPQKPS